MTAPLVDVDERTRDELAPPCDDTRDDEAATWVVRFKPGCEHTRSFYLACDVHAEPFKSGRCDAGGCWTCGAESLLADVEPLR